MALEEAENLDDQTGEGSQEGAVCEQRPEGKTPQPQAGGSVRYMGVYRFTEGQSDNRALKSPSPLPSFCS